jgi:beta-galactosidase
MKNRILVVVFFAILCCLSNYSCKMKMNEKINELAVNKEGRSEILFDAGWRFYRGDVAGAELVKFNDSAWRMLDLPHDWSIEDIPGTNSPVDSNAIGGIDAGYLVGGTAWYRKTFYVNSDIRQKVIHLQFDGVYMNADIWLNGQHLGNHPYGYTSFMYEITGMLLPGQNNTIAVSVRNEGRNSRWYSGSGIYRHVWISAMDPLHIGHWGTRITTPVVEISAARVNVRTSVFNESGESADVILVTRIINADRIEVAKTESSQTIAPGNQYEFVQDIEVVSPSLWSVESPVLYAAVNEIYRMNGKERSEVIDKVEDYFGIRTISVSTKRGFLLNNKPLKLKGGCMHHDNGPLGAAAFDRAEERRVELMKTSGYNAIRCAHNPPSPAFLAACDRLGILVIDEAFDMWREQKNPDDYHLYFDEWWQKDISSMVLRDINHPSVIFWSIGNEVPERGKPEGAALAHTLADYVKSLDPTRPVTSAVNSVSPDKDPYFTALDVSGYNYAISNYVSDHKRLPERIMFGSESYPLEAYDYWMAAIDNPWVIGDFVWTGYDYLGEASIGWLGYPHDGSFYPWTHAYCGDIDICGWKRPQSYYRDALWKDNQLSVFVKPPNPSFELNPKKEVWSKWEWQDVIASWNWKGYEGQLLKVEVYSSCDQVELFLNEKSLGRKETKRETRWIANWDVVYQAGVLRAVGYNDSRVTSSYELKTADDPQKILLTADRDSIRADGQDLSYVTVEILDAKGIRNPLAQNLVHFEIEGPGSILAVGNSNPMGIESFRQPMRKAYQGRCLVIIKAENQPGEIHLKVTSSGLNTSEITIYSLLLSGAEGEASEISD